jgi:sigma-70-like protein
MDRFDEIQQLREEYESVLDDAESRRTAYHQAIRKLYLSGASLSEIAERLGISRQRVHEIVGKEPAVRRRKRKQILGSAGILGVSLLVGAGAWFAISYERQPRPALPQPQRCAEPCPGWRYEAAYKPAGGEIVAVVQRKGTAFQGATAVSKSRHGEDAVRLAKTMINAERFGDPTLLPKGIAFRDVTGDPRLREMLRGDLDDYYITEGRIHRSRRELALGIAWGLIGAAGLATIVMWNRRASRRHLHPVVAGVF